MNIGKMMKQAQELQAKMEEAQRAVAELEVEGSSGAGLVTVTMTGKNEVRSLNIDPSLLKEDEVDMLEDLIIAALNDAHTKVVKASEEKMGAVTGGLNLPGGMKLPF